MSIYDDDLRYYVRDPIVKELKNLRETFENRAVKAPKIVSEAPEGGAFVRQDSNSAVRVTRLGDDLALMYHFDFAAQTATVMSFQSGELRVTETRKLSEMPSKIVQEAQKAVDSGNKATQHRNICKKTGLNS
ncbi:MAG: hypothetical protein EA357_05645 [Micavibrio sp.]|nr:MAG: hypothetical protein EA357_05645 [Micavibrio sp.]